MPGPPSWSVVIPTLDEEAALPRLLHALEGVHDEAEIIVSDGGSRDRTEQIARDAGVRFVEGPRGRAQQMNTGAGLACGERLLFLHADTVPGGGALHAASSVLENSGVIAGCFPVRFESSHPILWGAGWKTHLWVRLLGFLPGDHGLFVRRVDFEAAGGFPDIPILEDRHLCRILRRQGSLAVAPVCAQVSARRVHGHGILRTYARMLGVLVLDTFGANPERLKALYRGNPR